ncbi:MAG: hypothetical protein L0387_35850 [Acidobacteria bacterium]|nr:hypothetical protein [Acidobacteriota bacterium]MCI0717831.1 hypothetical protein [Acidobacteriota bacterium]
MEQTFHGVSFERQFDRNSRSGCFPEQASDRAIMDWWTPPEILRKASGDSKAEIKWASRFYLLCPWKIEQKNGITVMR